MSEGSFTTNLVHSWLQQVADNAWISLHYDSPGLGGTGAAEISGGGYVRFKMSFSQPSNRAIWSLIDAKFTGLTANQLTHFGIWDARYQGNLLAYAALPERKIVTNGQGYLINEGELGLSIG